MNEENNLVLAFTIIGLLAVAVLFYKATVTTAKAMGDCGIIGIAQLLNN